MRIRLSHDDSMHLTTEHDTSDPAQQALQQRVRSALGLPQGPGPATRLDWLKLHDALDDMVAEGLPLPQGATQEILDIVNDQVGGNARGAAC